MAKTTATITATRSLDQIAEEFGQITDPGSMRLAQSRLAYEYIGSAESKEAGELKDKFRAAVNVRLTARHTGEVSKPVIDNLLNTWRYMLRANVTPTAEIASVAYNLASQGIAKKDDTYVTPAIAAIIKGADPVQEFVNAKKKIDAAKKAAKELKDANPEVSVKAADADISFDVIISTLGMITPDYFASLNDEHKTALSTALAAANMASAE